MSDLLPPPGMKTLYVRDYRTGELKLFQWKCDARTGVLADIAVSCFGMGAPGSFLLQRDDGKVFERDKTLYESGAYNYMVLDLTPAPSGGV